MLYPQVFQPEADPGTLYTAIDKNGKASIRACFGRGFVQEVSRIMSAFTPCFQEIITGSTLDTMMASPRSDQKQIVYVGKPTSAHDQFQLYIADLVPNLVMNFDGKPMTEVNRYINPNTELLSSVELDGQLGKVRLK
jgi:hypothetical protein